MCRFHLLRNEMRSNTSVLTFLTLDSSISKMAGFFPFNTGTLIRDTIKKTRYLRSKIEKAILIEEKS